jgi:CRP-like cAMP-binding protein
MFRTPTFFPSAFCGLSCTRDELAELTRLAAPVRFNGGQTIFSEGERAESAFGLSRGVVRLYKLLPDGRRQVVAFTLPGDFLGMPLADRFNCSADAIGEVSVSRFPREKLKRLIQSSPNLQRLLIEFATRELWGGEERPQSDDRTSHGTRPWIWVSLSLIVTRPRGRNAAARWKRATGQGSVMLVASVPRAARPARRPFSS